MGLEIMEHLIIVCCVIMLISYVQVTMWKDEGKL